MKFCSIAAGYVTLLFVMSFALNALCQEQHGPITVSVKGDVTILVDGGKRQVQVREALSGDKLVIGKKSSVLIVFPKVNRLERLVVKGDQPIEVSLSTDGAKSAAGLTITKIAAKLSPDMLAGLPINAVGAAGRSRGDVDSPPACYSPINNSRVLSTKPTFSWPKHENAVRYQIKVLEDGAPVFEKQTEEVTLEYPSQLDRQLSYDWQVTAILQDNSRVRIIPQDKGTATFKVAEEWFVEEADELSKLLGLGEEDEKAALLNIIALRYEKLQLYNEAIEANEQVVKLEPKSASNHAALFELYGRAGRIEDAKKARDIAEKLGFEFTDEKAE